LREAEVGNFSQADRQASAALALATGKDLQTMAALAFARAGDESRALAIMRDLNRRFATDTLLNRYWLPTIQAAVEIARQNPEKAISTLQAAEPYELGGPPVSLDTLYPVYLRGIAYLADHKGDAAAAQFQKIVDHRGRVANCSLGALAYLQLARAYVLSEDKKRGQQALQEFLALWKDGDRDAPLLREAQRELAHVK